MANRKWLYVASIVVLASLLGACVAPPAPAPAQPAAPAAAATDVPAAATTAPVAAKPAAGSGLNTVHYYSGTLGLKAMTDLFQGFNHGQSRVQGHG